MKSSKAQGVDKPAKVESGKDKVETEGMEGLFLLFFFFCIGTWCPHFRRRKTPPPPTHTHTHSDKYKLANYTLHCAIVMDNGVGLNFSLLIVDFVTVFNEQNADCTLF